MSDFEANNGELDDRDKGLVAALAAGATMDEAAVRVGLCTRQAYRRARRPLFKAALSEARTRRWVPASDYLLTQVERICRQLVTIADDATVRADIRLKAMMGVVGLATGLHKLVTEGTSLAALEASLDTQTTDEGHGDADAT